MAGFSVKLNRIQYFVLLQQVLSVLGEQRVYFPYVVRLSQVNSSVPLIQMYAAIDGLLDAITLRNKATVIL